MDTLFYLSKLILSLIVGVIFGKIVSKKICAKVAKLQNPNLFVLLFFMGVNTGAIEGILTKLNTIGAQAFIVAISNIIGTTVIAFIASLVIERKDKLVIDSGGTLKIKTANITVSDVNKILGSEISVEGEKLLKRHRLTRIINIIREPLMLVSVILLGLLLKVFTPAFDWFKPSLITYLLYVLLFFSGVGLINSNLKIKEVFDSPWLLLLPLWTIIGTYLGALIIPLLTPYTIREALGLSSGFGWYSLSGIMITDLGYPMLGSISFLSNVFRESLTFFLVPFLAKFGNRMYYSAVCSGGATTMDVTLPLISTHFGASTMVPSMYHGVVLTILVPFLIPLFF
ncbi:MAG: lysine exporter LysO family protein [Spirochaetaceae bacterium]|nr:lysine exporter LysO family protein [Spirochaetaceae bacterium]